MLLVQGADKHYLLMCREQVMYVAVIIALCGNTHLFSRTDRL